MRILGINCMNHDAAMAVVDYSSGIGEVLWAAHADGRSPPPAGGTLRAPGLGPTSSVWPCPGPPRC